MLAAEALEIVQIWVTEAILQLAHHKAAVVLVSNREAVQHVKIYVGVHENVSDWALKHLEMMVDDCFIFNAFVDYDCKRQWWSTREQRTC